MGYVNPQILRCTCASISGPRYSLCVEISSPPVLHADEVVRVDGGSGVGVGVGVVVGIAVGIAVGVVVGSTGVNVALASGVGVPVG